MVERKLRPAPSPLHPSASSRKPARPGASPVTKLFVLDTNVLMHDPTSLFRFEEHDIYLPILTLEELDNNKKGVTEVARNARQASRFLDELVTAQPGTSADAIVERHPAGREVAAAPPAAGCTCRPRRSRRCCRRRSPMARPTTRSSRW